MEVTVKIAVCHDVMLRKLEEGENLFRHLDGGSSSDTLKNQYTYTRLHGITSQNTATCGILSYVQCPRIEQASKHAHAHTHTQISSQQ